MHTHTQAGVRRQNRTSANKGNRVMDTETDTRKYSLPPKNTTHKSACLPTDAPHPPAVVRQWREWLLLPICTLHKNYLEQRHAGLERTTTRPRALKGKRPTGCGTQPRQLGGGVGYAGGRYQPLGDGYPCGGGPIIMCMPMGTPCSMPPIMTGTEPWKGMGMAPPGTGYP